MLRRKDFRKKLLLVSLIAGIIVTAVVLLKDRESLTEIPLSLSSRVKSVTKNTRAPSAGSCPTPSDCPQAHFSFYIRSGAASVVAPMICVQNQLLLGATLINSGVGINIVVINGQTGVVIKTGFYDMYSGDVKHLIEFLKSIEAGSLVLMASYDDPATKLNEEARKLIADLGSSIIQSVGFRDSWVFVGGKGTNVKSNFERFLKNDPAHNKYDGWPELIELQGCVPQIQE